MGIYAELGIRPVINASATLTRLGGSLMPPEVLAAMQEAAGSFVRIDELQERVGAKIAELTHNEAAYVATGAAAGIVLAVAACMTRGEPNAMAALPATDGLPNEVLLFRSHRVPYDHAVLNAGGKLVLLGDGRHTEPAELAQAITPRAAALIWFQGTFCGQGDLPIEQVIDLCRARGLPVLVDAAAQLPPVENLWRFTQMGAAAAIFSGGKDLCGPQASGLVVGQRWLVEAMQRLGSPNPGLGRPMKVGKEEMAGLYAAVKRYLALDHDARRMRDERVVAEWCQAFGALPGVRARRSFPNEAGQPLPRLEVTLDPAARLSPDHLMAALRAGTPSIEVGGAAGQPALYFNPMTLSDAEASLVTKRMLELLT
jgi:uncharacterized pyridoxal phosphate-dependent enzyme